MTYQVKRRDWDGVSQTRAIIPISFLRVIKNCAQTDKMGAILSLESRLRDCGGGFGLREAIAVVNTLAGIEGSSLTRVIIKEGIDIAEFNIIFKS